MHLLDYSLFPNKGTISHGSQVVSENRKMKQAEKGQVAPHVRFEMLLVRVILILENFEFSENFVKWNAKGPIFFLKKKDGAFPKPFCTFLLKVIGLAIWEGFTEVFEIGSSENT